MVSLKSFWGIFGMGAMKKCDYNATVTSSQEENTVSENENKFNENNL